MLSDILLNQDGSIPPFPRDGANHVLMGRFGNVMLTNGTTSYTLSVQKNEVVRLYLTNAVPAGHVDAVVDDLQVRGGYG
jgi:hypothetical protein